MGTGPASNANKSQTIDQRRAKHAWEAVARLAIGSSEADDYAREAKKLPVRIVTASLGHALSFIEAKSQKKRGLKNLCDDLDDWAKNRLAGIRSDCTLLEAIISRDAEFLRRATDEILAYLAWLNRFTEAKGLPLKTGND